MSKERKNEDIKKNRYEVLYAYRITLLASYTMQSPQTLSKLINFPFHLSLWDISATVKEIISLYNKILGRLEEWDYARKCYFCYLDLSVLVDSL